MSQSLVSAIGFSYSNLWSFRSDGGDVGQTRADQSGLQKNRGLSLVIFNEVNVGSGRRAGTFQFYAQQTAILNPV